MLLLFAILLSGIVTGRLLWGRRLRFVPRLITGIIRVLLFLLGVEVGADPAIVGGLFTLGRTAFVLFAFSVAGSIASAWLLGRWVRGNCPADAARDGERVPLWRTLRGSLVIVALFAAGCVAGGLFVVPCDPASSRLSTWVLYALMFTVGVSLGNDRTLAGEIRRLDPRLALLPAVTAVGTLAGAALAARFVAPWGLTDSLAVGAGFGYYSLSGIFISDLRSAELGTVALLCNILRELFTLVAAPLVARWAGPLAAVSIGGATSFDTTLPVITCAAGRPYAVVAVFHGCALDLSVPFLVTLFCML
ncbi:LysO family transporter [Alistipes sp.]|uniref:lysine exporter LysO family protein n=1 Tax=Alistipes sp. TaxID=1872444 RepID=UPI003AF10BEC